MASQTGWTLAAGQDELVHSNHSGLFQDAQDRSYTERIVTMVKDATADFSDEKMHATLYINIPNYASAIVATEQVVDSISSLKTLAISAQS